MSKSSLPKPQPMAVMSDCPEEEQRRVWEFVEDGAEHFASATADERNCLVVVAVLIMLLNSVVGVAQAALSKDPLGVSFNALPNIFDLQSRHIKDDLSIIGIDVKKNLEESFSDKTTLDDIITVLESGKVSEVAVEKIGVSYNGSDEAINQFLNWVLTAGTKYNHEYGLLNLDDKLTQVQIEKVKTVFTAQK